MSSPLKRRRDEDDDEVGEEEGSPMKRQRLLPLKRRPLASTVMDIDPVAPPITEGEVAEEEDGDYSTLEKDYDQYKAEIIGSTHWNEEQSNLHKLIYMRGEIPMLAFSWRYNFKMWGVDTKVYAKESSTEKLAISALTSEFKAGKALEDLFELSVQVQRWIDMGEVARIPRTVVKSLKRYVAWAKRDAGAENKDFPP
jgi:hypothetical protein